MPSLACSSSHDSSADQNAITAGVLLEGDATTAQLSAVLSRKPLDWDWAGGQFDTPDDEATLAADTPASFGWHADPPAFAGADGVVTTYLLAFNASDNSDVLRVFTTLPEYTPDETAWSKLVAASQPITSSITTSHFIGAELPQAGGPFIGQTITLTIE